MADELVDERTGQRYDYSKKRGVLGAELMLPEGAPAWMQDRSALWNAVEAIEKRKDAQLARDFIISLPHQLDHEQRVALTREFVREQFCARGYVADIAWHTPDKTDGLNFHAHVMVAMRKIEGTGFARKKERAPEDGLKHPALVWKEELMRLRVVWADTANRHLAAAGLDIRIDHRSLEARGIDREPEPKMGPLATQIEREGRESLAGADRREVKARNAEREQLKLEHAKAAAEEAQIVDLMVHRLRSGDMQVEAPTEEVLRQQQAREAAALREMREQDARLQAFKLRAEQDADDARRKRADTEKDEARRHMQGDIASASARYSIALGEEYDVRDPYGSLARAAMQEYAMFHRRQEEMRDQIANEKDDPGKRREIELKREIEGCDYMAITSDRLAGMSAVIAGREDAPQAMLDRERARAYHDRARELREERSQLIEAREKQERHQVAEQLHTLGRSVQAGDTGKTNDKLAELERMEGAYIKHNARKQKDPDRDDGKTNDTKTQENNTQESKTNDNKRDDETPASGRKEGPEPELTDAKREKLAKLEGMEGAYTKHEAQKKNDPDRDDGGGRGGR